MKVLFENVRRLNAISIVTSHGIDEKQWYGIYMVLGCVYFTNPVNESSEAPNLDAVATINLNNVGVYKYDQRGRRQKHRDQVNRTQAGINSEFQHTLEVHKSNKVPIAIHLFSCSYGFLLWYATIQKIVLQPRVGFLEVHASGSLVDDKPNKQTNPNTSDHYEHWENLPWGVFRSWYLFMLAVKGYQPLAHWTLGLDSKS